MLRFFSILLIVPILTLTVYRILKRATSRVLHELDESDGSLDERLDQLRQEQKKLKADCAEEAKDAKKREKNAQKIKQKL